jgi:hypothetical protein
MIRDIVLYIFVIFAVEENDALVIAFLIVKLGVDYWLGACGWRRQAEIGDGERWWSGQIDMGGCLLAEFLSTICFLFLFLFLFLFRSLSLSSELLCSLFLNFLF